MLKPNLFKLATKELSQDAFITWLIQWADTRFQSLNPALHVCAVDFVNMLLGMFDVPDNYIVSKVSAGRQWGNIDIWAKINDEYLIVIEDKTYTLEHSNQLLKYKDFAKKWCAENGYKLIPIYLKTGSESLASLNGIEYRTGFKVFPRKKLLSWLEKHSEINSDIVTDFRENLVALEESYSSFSKVNIGKWHWNSWVGLFQFLETEITLVGWQRVNNPSGGFWCAVLVWPIWQDFPVHLQIEERKLCFKIGFHYDDTGLEKSTYNVNQVQDEWQNMILAEARKLGLSMIKKPYPYVHRGDYRTVAVVEQQGWLGENNSLIDKVDVVKKLRTFCSFLRAITKEANQVLNTSNNES